MNIKQRGCCISEISFLVQQPIAVPRINPVLLLNHRGGSVFVLIFALILVFVLIFVLVALILILALVLTVVVLILVFILVPVIFEAFHYLKLRSFFQGTSLLWYDRRSFIQPYIFFTVSRICAV